MIRASQKLLLRSVECGGRRIVLKVVVDNVAFLMQGHPDPEDVRGVSNGSRI